MLASLQNGFKSQDKRADEAVGRKPSMQQVLLMDLLGLDAAGPLLHDAHACIQMVRDGCSGSSVCKCIWTSIENFNPAVAGSALVAALLTLVSVQFLT